MPLIDLKTNLTTLKFGGDRLNSGDSGQPYIKTPIIGDRYATQGAPKLLVDLAQMNKTSLDYPIRGGGEQFELGGQTLTLSSKVDRERIKKFLSDGTRGLTFINKQIGLQLTNPKIETGNTVNNTLASTNTFPGFNALPGVLENTRVYNNGKNTLEQVGLSGTGYHLPRAGLFPFDVTTRYYDKVVGAQNRMSADEVALENRLLILQQLKLRTSDQITNKGSVLGAINKINQLGISLNRNLIQNYLGGPGSTYGIGSTIIRRYDDTTLAVRKTRGRTGMTYDEITNQQVNEYTYSDKYNVVKSDEGTYYYPKRLEIQDFSDPRDGVDTSREETYGMSYGYSATDGTSVPDVIAQAGAGVEIYGFDPWKPSTSGDSYYGGIDDMIKFGFECISNDDPSNSLFIQFRAYLTNGISDNHQAAYSNFKYMGRGEDFYIYQGFTRTIGFSFRVAVENPQDLNPLYSKLNALASQVYPDYSKGGVMRTAVTRVTIGDYIYRMPGFIESVNITVNQDSSWEIEEGTQLPHYLDVNISFKPIHDKIPERVAPGSDTQNAIIHNVLGEKATPSSLNEGFYFDPITELEKRRIKRMIERKKKKDDNILKRKAGKDKREAARAANKLERDNKKANRISEREAAEAKKQADKDEYNRREADRIIKEWREKEAAYDLHLKTLEQISRFRQ